MTLDERINKDLTELYEEKEISAAKELQSVIEVSAKGLPQHFTGNRDAKTVFVTLNPGRDVKLADKSYNDCTKDYDKTTVQTFICDYIKKNTDFGKNDKDRRDSFDEKQAAFLKYFKDSGIDIPSKFPEEKTDELCLQAKQNVISQKCQLELIPYCSAKFSVSKAKAAVLVPYVETLLDEIFRVERRYVIFGGAIFAYLFEKMKAENIAIKLGEKVVWQIPDIKNPFTAHLVTFTRNGKTVKAVIARTFQRQDISRAYKAMAEYGKKCFELLKQ